MIRITVGAVLAFLCLPGAYADNMASDPADELAKLYIQRHNSPQIWLDQVIAIYVESYRGTVEDMAGRELTAEDEGALRQIIKRSLLAVVPETLWQEEMAAVFRKHLTEEELRDVLAFYSTTAGRKLLSVQNESGVEAGQAVAMIFRARQEQFVEDATAQILEAFLPKDAEQSGASTE